MPARRSATGADRDTVGRLIDRPAAREPQNPALFDRGKTWTYGALAAESQRLAGGLKRLGFGAGDRVAFWLPNIAQYLALHIACARIGAITVSVNTRFQASEVGDIVERSGCRALVLWPSFKKIPFLQILERVQSTALAQLESIIIYADGEPLPSLPGTLAGRSLIDYQELASCEEFTGDDAQPENGVVVFTTSGTTAAPKFVLHSHASITGHASDVMEFFGWCKPDTVILQVVPLCGTFGHAQAMAGLAAGRPLVMMPVFSGPEATDLMHQHKVTHCNGSDEMFARMLDASDAPLAFPSFQYGGYAAFNPVYQDIVARADKRGMKLVGLWGMSEMQALYARQDPTETVDVRHRRGGMLVSKTAKVRVRDTEQGTLLPHGEVGELEVRGPSRMSEYFGDTVASQSVLTDDGFVRTGDLGYTENDQQFVFLGRMGDAIRLGGFLVNPAEIEAHLQTHAAVDRAQVVAVDTPQGTRAFAFVITNRTQAFDESTLLAHCADGIAGCKVPVGIQKLTRLPVTESANGVKIQRNRLREMAADNLKSG